MAENDQNSTVALNGSEDSQGALLDLLGGMRRTLSLYTPFLRPELYNDAKVLAAIRERIVTQPKVRLQLVLPPAREWRSACPGLIRLSERLTTALLLRTPNRPELPNWPELAHAFMIADERALLRFSDPRRLIGEYDPQPIERMKELLELFRVIWDRSEPDPDLGRIGL